LKGFQKIKKYLEIYNEEAGRRISYMFSNIYRNSKGLAKLAAKKVLRYK